MRQLNYVRPLIVFGTRPEAIKMAPIIKEFKKYDKVQVVNLCVSQHVHMLEQVLNVFGICAHHNLNVMSPNQTLFSITEKALHGFQRILQKIKPDIILVQGDTTSAFAGALAGFYMKIPVAHVEAGLRTYNKFSPYPEDINRRLIGTLADHHFPPTRKAELNLKHEGIEGENVFVAGNTVIDAILMIAEKEFDISFVKDPNLREQILQIDPNKNMVLITAHRRENFGKPFVRILDAIKALSKIHPNVEFVYPVHLNPNVSKPVKKSLNGLKNIHLLAPLEYDVFVAMMKKAYLLLTDSGGVQEEAPSLGKPVLVLREVTERPEAVEAGSVKLVGTDKKKIINSVSLLLESKNAYDRMAKVVNPYGDGKAAERIVRILLGFSAQPFKAIL